MPAQAAAATCLPPQPRSEQAAPCVGHDSARSARNGTTAAKWPFTRNFRKADWQAKCLTRINPLLQMYYDKIVSAAMALVTVLGVWRFHI